MFQQVLLFPEVTSNPEMMTETHYLPEALQEAHVQAIQLILTGLQLAVVFPKEAKADVSKVVISLYHPEHPKGSGWNKAL